MNSPSDNEVLAAIAERIGRRRHLGVAISAGAPPPPCSPELVSAAEREIGYKLPLLLCRIYTEVANGGVGPSLGLNGLTGGWEGDGGTALAQYRVWRSRLGAGHFGIWSAAFFPVWDRGDGEFEAIDCGDPEAALYEWAGSTDEPLTVANALRKTGRTFRSRLVGWLDATARNASEMTMDERVGGD
jgi:hypothetical protein